MSESTAALHKIAELFRLAAIATDDASRRDQLSKTAAAADDMITRKTAAGMMNRLRFPAKPSIGTMGTAQVVPRNGAAPVMFARPQRPAAPSPAAAPVPSTPPAGGPRVIYSNPRRVATGGASQGTKPPSGVTPPVPTAQIPPSAIPPAGGGQPIPQSLLRRLAGKTGRVLANPFGSLAAFYALQGAGNVYTNITSGGSGPHTSNPEAVSLGSFPGLSRWWNSSDYGKNNWMQYREDAANNPNFNQLQDNDVINFGKMGASEQAQLYQAMLLAERNRQNAAAAKEAGKEYTWVNSPENPFDVSGLSDANLAMRMRTLAEANPLLSQLDKSFLPSRFAVPQATPPAAGTAGTAATPSLADQRAQAISQQLAARAAADEQRALALAKIRQEQAFLEALNPSVNPTTGAGTSRFLAGR